VSREDLGGCAHLVGQSGAGGGWGGVCHGDRSPLVLECLVVWASPSSTASSSPTARASSPTARAAPTVHHATQGGTHGGGRGGGTCEGDGGACEEHAHVLMTLRIEPEERLLGGAAAVGGGHRLKRHPLEVAVRAHVVLYPSEAGQFPPGAVWQGERVVQARLQ
jgi:hypothetical protein